MIKNAQSGRVCFWKAARVVLIPKSTAKSCSYGYKPISLLLIPSKTPWYCFNLLITDNHTEHHPISGTQWGFQKGKSTLTVHDWLINWMRMKKYAVYFLTSRRPLMMFRIPTKDLWKTETDLFASLIVTRLCSYFTKRRPKCCNQWSIFTFHPCDFWCTPGLGFRAVALPGIYWQHYYITPFWK